MGYKRDIKENTKKLLYANSGNVCAMYGCTNQLMYASTANISEICHIEAVNEDGPRYNPNLTNEEVNSYDNLILLCPTHHTLIDSKAEEINYSVSYLKEMKKYHENQVKELFCTSFSIPMFEFPDNALKTIVNYINSTYIWNYTDIDTTYVSKVLESFFSMKSFSRQIMHYVLTKSIENNDTEINMVLIRNMDNMDLNELSETFQLLEMNDFVRETKWNGPLAGFEDGDGDYHLVENNYLFKICQGEWYLYKNSLILKSIFDLLNNNKLKYHDLLINKNLNEL